MSVIRFTQEDARWIMLPPLTAGYTGVVAISCAEARECEGINVGKSWKQRFPPKNWHDGMIAMPNGLRFGTTGT
jgi:hypothetical protein